MPRPTSARSARADAAFCQRLAELQGDLSVYAFAKKCGVTQTAMHKYLDGRALPGLRSVVAIAQTNGVTIDWLVHGGSVSALDARILESLLASALRPPLRAVGLKDDDSDALAKNLAFQVSLFYRLATTGGPKGVMSLKDVERTFEKLGELVTASIANAKQRQKP